MSPNLLGFDRGALEAFCAAWGEKPYRARQLLRWIHRRGVERFEEMTDLARPLRARLAAEARIAPPRIESEAHDADGTRRFRVRVDAANAVETVYIPETGRGTLCVSVQAGCALECAFCATGKQGFARNLDASDIIGQLWLAGRRLATAAAPRPITNVVLMGMGEPLANLDAVLPALRLMLDDDAYGLSRRRVTVSTAGLVPGIDRLREECPVALAVSLHAPSDALRDRLVPVNRRWPIAELLAACRRYLERSPRDFVTFEYVMLEGVNDGESEARALAALGRQVRCKFNLIPFNPFPGSAFRRSPPERIRGFAQVLQGAGFTVTVRRTRGEEIDAACGQLAGAVRDRTRRGERRAPAALVETAP